VPGALFAYGREPLSCCNCLVGVAGFEPATPSSRTSSPHTKLLKNQERSAAKAMNAVRTFAHFCSDICSKREYRAGPVEPIEDDPIENASTFAPARMLPGVDTRFAFLARGAARLHFVEAGAMDLDEAFHGLVCNPCQCSREIVERWERDYPRRLRKRRAA
jgi:hypothetical protein